MRFYLNLKPLTRCMKIKMNSSAIINSTLEVGSVKLETVVFS